LEILEQISKTFEEVFKQKLPEFLKKKHKETTKGLGKSTLSLGLGVAGFVPCISTIAASLSLPPTSREFFNNRAYLATVLRTSAQIPRYARNFRYAQTLGETVALNME